jgi:hypothetical protein
VYWPCFKLHALSSTIWLNRSAKVCTKAANCPVSTCGGLLEMTNENGNHNVLPLDDPAFKWAWEIYKEADHLVHSCTTFFFAAQSFLVVAYSTFAVSRSNWKENQSIYVIAMGIIVFTGIVFSLVLWELNYTVTKRMKQKLRDPYLERNPLWKEYAQPGWLPARIIFGTIIPICLLLIWTGFGITTLLIARLPS